MSASAFAVYLHDEAIGGIRRTGDHVTFRFADRYVADSDRKVLGLRFEEDLGKTHFGNRRFPAWFSNLLPEGALRALIRSTAGYRGTDSALFDADADLFRVVGRDLPGAVQLAEVRPTDLDAIVREGDVVPASLDSTPEGSGREEAWRFSVAGVRLKFSTVVTAGRFTVPARNALGDWLIKLPDPHYPDLPTNEFAMMELARDIGIAAPSTVLAHRDEVHVGQDSHWGQETLAYAVERFDRLASGERVHIEDLAQVRGLYPSEKYTGTFETLAALIYRQRDRASFDEFIRRLVFNVLIGNSDAHLKNWSLIYGDGRVPTLSPAYDLVTVAPYRDASLSFDLGLKLGKSRGFERVTMDRFGRLSERLGIPPLETTDLVRGVIDAFERESPSAVEKLSRTETLAMAFVQHSERMVDQLLGRRRSA